MLLHFATSDISAILLFKNPPAAVKHFLSHARIVLFNWSL